MKNMMFIFRGLVKVSMLLVLMGSAQNIVAQSFGTQATAFTSNLSKDATTVDNADYVVATDAITSLNTAALTLKDNAPNVTTAAEKFATDLKMSYFRHIAGLINTGSSVQAAMTQSTSFLNDWFAKAGNTYGLTQSGVFQEALGLVSN